MHRVGQVESEAEFLQQRVDAVQDSARIGAGNDRRGCAVGDHETFRFLE